MKGDQRHIIELKRISEALQARIVIGDQIEKKYITGVYASDLMSDVLAYGKSGSLLLTGLNTIQAAISAYMAEFTGIVLLRGKIPDKETLLFAKEKNLVVLSSPDDTYEACLKIAHIQGEVTSLNKVEEPSVKVKHITTHNYKINGLDFASAGLVSTQIKTILKAIGYDPDLVRRVAIATYEAEMNVVMHAQRADVTLKASDKDIDVIISDEGKGIKDIEMAMKEGFSTATEEQRAMGFGAGMGLPNIKKNSDELHIESEVDKGTLLVTKFYVQ